MNTLKQKGNHIDHTKANVYLQLNNVSGEYFTGNPNPNPELPEGWKLKKLRHHNRTNFKGVLYTNGEEYAFVFLGTDVKNGKDWAANAKMSLGSPNAQCKQAVEFCNDMLAEYKIDPSKSKVTAVGNSEGGREVIEVLQQTLVKNGVTFNAYMRVNKEDYPPENFENLINYRTENDIVSKCGKTIGQDFIVPVKEDVRLKPVYSIVQSHRIDNIDTITNENAIPARDYAAITGRKFKNKFGEGILTPEEIGSIPKELYPLVDPDVNERLQKGAVANEAYNQVLLPLDELPDRIFEDSVDYIFEWVSEPDSCEECRKLDGTRYKRFEDIPEIPHPNCKCRLKIIAPRKGHINSLNFA